MLSDLKPIQTLNVHEPNFVFIVENPYERYCWNDWVFTDPAMKINFCLRPLPVCFQRPAHSIFKPEIKLDLLSLILLERV